jgi:uncharacterized membrane protein
MHAMSRLALSYLAVLLLVGALDYLWLRVIATTWYTQAMAHLMAPEPRLVAAAIFYFGYPVGLMIFAVVPSGGDALRALILGGLFGLFAYGTYNITNLAVMRDWSLSLTLIDIAWGIFVSAAGAVAGALAYRALRG